jgi:hypothetical protein
MPIDTDGVPEQDAATELRSERRTSRYRRVLVLVGAVGIPVLVFVLWWFQPQALLFDDVVDESFPAEAADQVDDGAEDDANDRESTDEDQDADAEEAGAATDEDPAAEDAEQASTGPVELATGSFVSRNRYTVTGTATTYQLEDEQRILRLEDFESTNGPDLFVYLTVAGTADDDAALEAEFIDLGVLTGNIGNQNYTIPAEVDLDRYTSVVIWCRRFTTSFGVTDLS